LQRVMLDTNVVSELMRLSPAEAVIAWFARYPQIRLFTSTVTQAEILFGIELLPEGKRKKGMMKDARVMFEEDFAGNCLPFDSEAASEFAILAAHRKNAGKPISTADAQIAAIALSHQLPLVTRNTIDFFGVNGLQVIDPWQA